MLGGLFKPAWQSDSPEKRCLAIQKLSVEGGANQAVFEQLALSDSEQSVRLACIKQINIPASLFKIYQRQSDEQTSHAAKAAFCNLIGSNSTLSEEQFQRLLSECNEASLLVAQYCPHATLRTQLIDALDQTQKAKAIADVHYADTRFYIAKQLEQIEALEIARRSLKGKDKKSEKIIRTKLEKIRAQHKLENDVNENALELCELMEFIANHPQWRSEFKAKYDQYSQRWSALELTPAESAHTRFNAAANAAQLKVAQQIEVETARQNQSQVAEKLENYCTKLAPLTLSELADEHLSINIVLGEALATWLENGDVAPSAPSVSTRFLNAQSALSTLSDLIESTAAEDIDLRTLASNLNNISWQTGYQKLSAQAEASELLKDLRLRTSAQAKQDKDNLDALHKRINRLLGTSNKGDIKKARHELSATAKAASQYLGKERKILDERLEIAAETVSKMSDWQSFAIEPKLIELCDSMEQLVNSNAHPDKLAKEISKLQNAWKNLGHADVSDDHWRRFKAAADLAYAPCSTFFEQRRATQKDNLARREVLVARMRSVLDDTDWNNTPDYKQVEIELRSIDNDWRKIKDVERKAGQKQWDRLSAIRASIYEKLDVVYDANIELKNQIISQVNAIADGAVNDDSLDRLKVFQGRWQQIGVTRRKQDQEAWKLFKAAGDRLYENVKSLRNEKRANEDEQIGAYRDIIKQIYALAKSATNLAEADTRFDELSESYASLPPLPKNLPEKLINRLESDFRRAGEDFSKTHDRIIQASKDNVLNALGEKATLCGQLEAAISQGNTAAISELEQTLEQLEISDKALEKRFESRLNSVRDTDKSAANEARTLLCIELEILLDIASPEEDKARRMRIQLERMKVAGIGQPPIKRKSMLDELKLDWLCLPGAEPELQAKLDVRFGALICRNSDPI